MHKGVTLYQCTNSLSIMPLWFCSTATIWKYNVKFHIATDHSALPTIPAELVECSSHQWRSISPENTQQWRVDNESPDTDGIEAIKEEINAKREWSESTGTQPPHKNPQTF